MEPPLDKRCFNSIKVQILSWTLFKVNYKLTPMIAKIRPQFGQTLVLKTKSFSLLNFTIFPALCTALQQEPSMETLLKIVLNFFCLLLSYHNDPDYICTKELQKLGVGAGTVLPTPGTFLPASSIKGIVSKD